MRAEQRVTPEVPESILRGTELADLAMLYDPDVMLVTAPTLPGPAARRHAEALAQAKLGHSTLEVSTPEGTPSPGALRRLAVGDGEGAGAWVTYLEEVTSLFAHLLGARVVGVRQIVSEGPHCPRFHVDRVPARGVLNVVGACTEWLDEPDVDRDRLGHAGGAEDLTSGLVLDWHGLERAEPGALAVFKGTAWPGAEDRAVVHRSPPPDGGRRLLLTLDWLE